MSREYDAFGNTVLQKGGSSVKRRLSLPWFSSKIQDEETGLYYYGYREDEGRQWGVGRQVGEQDLPEE